MRVMRCFICRDWFLRMSWDGKLCSSECRRAYRELNDLHKAGMLARVHLIRTPAVDQPDAVANIVCRECGVRRYDGEQCEVCGSRSALKLLDNGE